MYDKNTGKRWCLFSNVMSSSALSIREMYSTSILYSGGFGLGFTGRNGLFFYGGYLYTLTRNSFAGNDLILIKINVSTGARTDVKTLKSIALLQGFGFVFDGVDTIYYNIYSGSGTFNMNFSKYNLASDTITSLHDSATDFGGLSGMGVDSTYLYALISYSGPGGHKSVRMTLAGGSYTVADLGVIGNVLCGYKGFYIRVASNVISINGGSSFTFSGFSAGNSVLAVFVDDSQGIANSRFFVFYYDLANTVYFQEYDGATLKSSMSVSISGITVYSIGIHSMRPDTTIEEAVSIYYHSSAAFFEVSSIMKEVT